MSVDGMVWGSYIHGLFDQPGFRRAWLNRVRERKGLPLLKESVSEEVSHRLDQALDRWADHVQKHLNTLQVEKILKHRVLLTVRMLDKDRLSFLLSSPHN